MTISPTTIKIIRASGALLLVLGGTLLAWAFSRFESLPNYQRLGAMVPFAFGVSMFTISDILDYSSLSPRQKGRTVAWLFIPFILLVGTLMWYVNDPGAAS
jgi:hypothetical protein